MAQSMSSSSKLHLRCVSTRCYTSPMTLLICSWPKQSSIRARSTACSTRGSPCAWLGCRRADTRQAVFAQVMASTSVKNLRDALVNTATDHKEWLVCSHDATFQVLFSAIGQLPMQQKKGEYHALHTFLGRSGAVPGFSLQSTEGPANFCSAVAEVLPLSARLTA